MNTLRGIIIVLFVFLIVPCQVWAVSVVVDAGHGGSDPGAIGVNGLQEKDVTLNIAYALRDQLNKRGYHAILSRSDDKYISLQDRVDFTKSQQADLFVSVHANSYKNADTRGTMVLYYDDRYPQASYPASEAMKKLTPESRELAQDVLQSTINKTGTENRGLMESAAYVIRSGQVPSILVETAFLSNAQDAELLKNTSELHKFADGIADGIEAYRPVKASSAVNHGIIFPDTLGHWARDAVLKLQARGIVTGAADNQFEPDRHLTRAEFLTILNRMFSFSSSKTGNGSTVVSSVYGLATKITPSDLPQDHWAYSTIIGALSSGLIQGYEDDTVRPDQPITRGEVAALLDGILTVSTKTEPVLPSNLEFKDVPSDLWSAEPIYDLKRRGMIEGMTTDTFAPERLMTRAEMAALMARYYS